MGSDLRVGGLRFKGGWGQIYGWMGCVGSDLRVGGVRFKGGWGQIYGWMGRVGRRVNIFHYNALLSAADRSASWPVALRLLHDMVHPLFRVQGLGLRV